MHHKNAQHDKGKQPAGKLIPENSATFFLLRNLSCPTSIFQDSTESRGYVQMYINVL